MRYEKCDVQQNFLPLCQTFTDIQMLGKQVGMKNRGGHIKSVVVLH